MDFNAVPEDRDPLRTIRRREATLRSDLRILERAGRIERVPGGKRQRRHVVVAWRKCDG